MEKSLGKGKFFVLEGIDGSGKSTQIKLLYNLLVRKGYKVYKTFEPTDNPIGSLIRQIMKGRIDADEHTIAALFLADRLDHIYNHINGMLKKIESGYIVISDRYYFSSYAYHSTIVPLNWIIQANSICVEALKPDLNIFLDITPSESLKRLKKDRPTLELYENFEHLEKVRNQYLMSFEKLNNRENISIINASQTEEEVFQEISKQVLNMLGL